MRLTNRAGGFAAAIFLLSLGIFNPTPSRAWEMNLPNVATPTPVPAPSVAPAVETAPISSTTAAPAAEAAPVAETPAAEASPEPKPIAAPRRSLAEAVEAYVGAGGDAEHDCLATAVYFEAKGEPLRGQLAVAQVILNRIHSGRFPASVCGVVKQRGQFSFVRGGRLPAAPRASAAWRTAAAIARRALDGTSERPAANALFFHARSVSAGWHAVRVAAIGNHLFYR